MDKNGLLLQVIAARGAMPERKVLIWTDRLGPHCNDCAEAWLMGEEPRFSEPVETEHGYPILAFLGDKHHQNEEHFICLQCGDKLSTHA